MRTSTLTAQLKVTSAAAGQSHFYTSKSLHSSFLSWKLLVEFLIYITHKSCSLQRVKVFSSFLGEDMGDTLMLCYLMSCPTATHHYSACNFRNHDRVIIRRGTLRFMIFQESGLGLHGCQCKCPNHLAERVITSSWLNKWLFIQSGQCTIQAPQQY